MLCPKCKKDERTAFAFDQKLGMVEQCPCGYEFGPVASAGSALPALVQVAPPTLTAQPARTSTPKAASNDLIGQLRARLVDLCLEEARLDGVRAERKAIEKMLAAYDSVPKPVKAVSAEDILPHAFPTKRARKKTTEPS